MGKAQWDFSKSWASTITAVGALLATVLSTKGIGTLLSLYAALSIFFGILVAVAPLVYSATGQERPIDTPTGQQSLQYKGRVLAFLVTCMLTLWAVFDELETIIPLLKDLTTAPPAGQQPQSFFSSSIILMLQIFVIGAMILVAVYALTSIYWTVKEQVSQTAKKNRQEALYVARVKYRQELSEATRVAISERAQNELEPEQPSWSLL